MEILLTGLVHLLLLAPAPAPALTSSSLLRCQPGDDNVTSSVIKCSCERAEENKTVSVRNKTGINTNEFESPS